MPHVLNPLYVVVTKVILAIHSVLTPLFGKTSGVSWGLSLFFLTVLVRILLFPIFVKQIKTQRAMSELAPKVKELQTKYKKDRERMNQEVMALYKEHNANPVDGLSAAPAANACVLRTFPCSALHRRARGPGRRHEQGCGGVYRLFADQAEGFRFREVRLVP